MTNGPVCDGGFFCDRKGLPMWSDNSWRQLISVANLGTWFAWVVPTALPAGNRQQSRL